jgi:hypothetical protein
MTQAQLATRHARQEQRAVRIASQRHAFAAIRDAFIIGQAWHGRWIDSFEVSRDIPVT